MGMIYLRLPGRATDLIVDTGPASGCGCCGEMIFHVTTYVCPPDRDAPEGTPGRQEWRVVCSSAGCVASRTGELVLGLLDDSDGSYTPAEPRLRQSAARAAGAGLSSRPAGRPFPGCPLDRESGTRWGVYEPDPAEEEWHERKRLVAEKKEAQRNKVKATMLKKAARAAWVKRTLGVQGGYGVYEESRGVKK